MADGQAVDYAAGAQEFGGAPAQPQQPQNPNPASQSGSIDYAQGAKEFGGEPVQATPPAQQAAPQQATPQPDAQPKEVDNNPEWRAGKLSEAYELLKAGKIKEATHAALSIAPFVDAGSPERKIIDKIMDSAYAIPEHVTKGLDAAANSELGSHLDANAAVGFVKGGEETAHSVGHVLSRLAEVSSMHKAPDAFNIGSKEPDYLQSSNTEQSVGKGTEAIAEFVLGDESLKGLSLAEKLGVGQKIAKLAEDHPYISNMLKAGMNAVKGGTQTAAHGGDLKQSLESGGVVGVIDAALGTAGTAVNQVLKDSLPESYSIAGTKIPISKAQLAESPSQMTSVLKAGATPEAAQGYINNQIQPAAEAANRGNLGEVASNAVREADMARGLKPKATVFTGNNPQDMIDTMAKNAQKTYKVLDDAAANTPEHFEKMSDVTNSKQTLEEAQQALKDHMQSNKGLEAGAAGPKESSDALKIKTNSLKNDLGVAKEDYNNAKASLDQWESDNTFKNLQKQISDAKNAKIFDPQTLRTAQSKMQDYLDNFGGHVDEQELSAANKLWARKLQFEYLQKTLNNATVGTEGTPSALSKVKTNISYDTLKHLPGKFDNEFGTGAFNDLMGKQGKDNFDQILNVLKNPKEGASFTDYAIKTGGLKSTAVGKILGFFPNSILFNADKAKEILTGFKAKQGQAGLRTVYNGLSSALSNSVQNNNQQ